MKSNIGKGDNETVLSYIFWIFCKFQFISEKKDRTELKPSFKEAWKYSLEILEMNQNRVVDADAEKDQKCVLSISIVTYLRLCEDSKV